MRQSIHGEVPTIQTVLQISCKADRDRVPMIRIIAINSVSGDLKRFVIDHNRNGSMLQPSFNQVEAGKDLLHLFRKCICGNIPVLSGAISSYIIVHGTTNKECLKTGCLQHLKYGIHL